MKTPFTIWARKVVHQQIFNVSLEHVRSRSNKAYSEDEQGCVYSDPEGGCAIAPFITSYSKEMESKGVYDLLKNFSECMNPIVFQADVNFLNSIQTAHDNTPRGQTFHIGFNRRMKDIAEFQNLEYNEDSRFTS
jgi:hypothetical protein